MADPGQAVSQLPSSTDWIARKFAEIDQQLRELGPSISASFNTTIAQLTALVNAQISPDAGSAIGSGFTLNPSPQTVAAFNFTVPAGYSRALIIASGTINSANASTHSDSMYAKTIINGTSGPESVTQVGDFNLGPGAGVGNLTAVSSLSLSGLAGNTIRIEISTRSGMYSWSATAFSSAVIVAQAIYLR